MVLILKKDWILNCKILFYAFEMKVILMFIYKLLDYPAYIYLNIKKVFI